MPAIAGRLSTIELSEDGNTFVSLGGIVDITYNINIDEIETTAHDSNGARSYLPNFDDQTLDVSCRWIEGDVAQKLIIDAAKNKTLFYYRFRMQATSRTFVGRAFPTSMSLSGALDDVAGADFTLRCTVLDDPAPALDLAFAETLSLTDQATGADLITFTRATAATYVGSDGLIKTAASGQPRFDHHPMTGQSLGLLIEEQRTNLLTYSEQFDNAAWTKTRTSISANAALSPSGTTNAYKLIENTETNLHYLQQTVASMTGPHTISVYAKADTRSQIQLLSFGGTSTMARGFNLATGETFTETIPGAVASNDLGQSITPVGNGWYRCTMSWTATGQTSPAVVLSNQGLANYTGDGISGLFLWGFQVEVGAFPTSYIPTTTAAATRNVDDVLIDGANFSSWYNQNEGSFFTEYQRPYHAAAVGQGYPRVFSVSQGASTTNRILIYSSAFALPGSEAVQTYIGGVATATIAHPPSIGANESAKMSMSYSATLSQVSSCRDGGAAINDTSAAIYTSMDRIRLGAATNTTSFHNGTIERLTYYSTRINNAILQGLTSR